MDENHLGRRQGTFGVAPWSARHYLSRMLVRGIWAVTVAFLLASLIALVAVLVIALVGSDESVANTFDEFVVGLYLLLIGAAAVVSCVVIGRSALIHRQGLGATLTLYEDGLTLTTPRGTCVVFPWAGTDLYERGSGFYRLVNREGEAVTLRGTDPLFALIPPVRTPGRLAMRFAPFEGESQWERALNSGIQDAVLRRAEAELAAGRHVHFGRLSLSHDELTIRRPLRADKIVPLAEIGSAGAVVGEVIIVTHRKARLTPVYVGNVYNAPNVDAFERLVRRLLEENRSRRLPRTPRLRRHELPLR